jgi:hypothetical protein
MSFLKAFFFTLPLAAIASIVMAYFFTTQWIQPRFDEVIGKMEAATQAATASSEAIDTIKQHIEDVARRTNQAGQ